MTLYLYPIYADGKLWCFSVNGSPAKKKGDDSFSEKGSGSEIEFDTPPATTERERSRRTAAKKIIYDLDSDEVSEGEMELHDNVAVTEKDVPAPTQIVSSDSESDAPPPRNETSEDMFDSLIGKKSDSQDSEETNGHNEDKSSSKRKSFSGSESETETQMLNKKKKVDKESKEVSEKKKIVIDSNSDSDLSFDDKPKKAKSKKKLIDSDSDFGEKLSKPKPQKKKATKKTAVDSDSEDEPLGSEKKKAPTKSKAKKTKKTSDSEDDFGAKKKTKRKNVSDDEDNGDAEEYQPPAKTASRTARGAAPKKYVFSDDDD